MESGCVFGVSVRATSSLISAKGGLRLWLVITPQL
jgi:hypothetical protein